MARRDGDRPAPAGARGCDRRAFLSTALAAAALPALPRLAAAAELPAAQGPVILTVSGAIAHTNAPGAAEFDLAMLRELGPTVIDTSTIWTDGVVRFEGVLLRQLLERLGAEGSEITATALNDYSVSFPMGEVHGDGPMLAYLRNGAPMPVRDKGPIWLVYPYDDNPAYRSERIYTRSVWQLNRLKISP